jgi:hypothetical protein
VSVLYGFGNTEVAIKNAERTINDLLKFCKKNNGKLYLHLDNGTTFCITDNVHLSFCTMIKIKE